jgi:uncharacterized protein YndB with AHSA1/START domain
VKGSAFVHTFKKYTINIIERKVMNYNQRTSITVTSEVSSPIEKVWNAWTVPEHITNWNNASDDWHTPRAENDLRPGGKFNIRMEAKDGTSGFDFEGVYDEVKIYEKIIYTMGDGRKVNVHFENKGSNVLVTETFEAEETNTIELQRAGWQSIMDNFKRYVERI